MSNAERPVPAPPLPQIGSYRLVEPLGSGGMSSVFRALHVESGHEVAVKVLPRTLAKNPTMLQRFLREAKTAEALEHPNIVAIYDRGTEGGRYYLVLEYVPGGDLHDRVRQAGPLPVAETIDIIQGVARGLDYAAQRGLIHRDIKPANILLTPTGEPKLADLGLAVGLEQEDERVTRDGTTVGTVDYMAPEQARDSRATSVRSDIYSLGCTVYHLLTGSAPFAGGDVPEKLRRHAFEPPPDVCSVRPDVPPEFATVLQTMLAKKPEARYGSYAELIAALEALTPGTEAGAEQRSAAIPYALIDDEPEEPLYALVDDEPEAPLYALVEDDESSGVDFLSSAAEGVDSTAEASTIPATPGTANARSGHPDRTGRPVTSPPAAPASRPEISLAELARIEDDSEPGPRHRRFAPSPLPAQARARFDDEEAVIPVLGAVPRVARYDDDSSVRDWIVRGLMIGVAIVLIGFGIIQLVSFQWSTPGDPQDEPAQAVAPGASDVDHAEAPGHVPYVPLSEPVGPAASGTAELRLLRLPRRVISGPSDGPVRAAPGRFPITC